MDLMDFLQWVLNAGGSAVILSFVMERIPKFQLQTADTKRWIFFIGSFVISVAVYCVINYVPAEIINQISPFFMLAYATFSANFAGSVFHTLDKNIEELGKL